MKLINFSLEESTRGIILFGLGLEWDLHNYVSFSGLTFDAAANTLRLDWLAPAVGNPWGCPSNKARGCSIVFHRVLTFKTGPSASCPQFGEADTLHGVSRVTAESGKFRFRKEWPDSKPFNLLFEFGNGWAIEISAESATLEAVA